VLLVSVPIGGLGDRFGRLPTIRLAACLCVVSVGALAYFHDPIVSGAIMAVRGIAITAFVTAEFAYAGAVVAPERAISATAILGIGRKSQFRDCPGGRFLAPAARDRAPTILVSGRLALVVAPIRSGLHAPKRFALWSEGRLRRI